jgi:tRNA-dihydrouridine synthase B
MKLKIGQLVFDSPLIQAPLAGYSCAPMRKLAHQYGGLAYSCTEMLSAQHIFSGGRQKRRFSYKDPDEGLVCFQLAGNNPTILAEACRKSLSWGADLIDLNCGCPQPKIRKKNIGSRLLDNPDKLYQLIVAMKKSVDIPVTVKIRVDGHSNDNYNTAVCDAIEKAGADAIIIHGRHWTERYDSPIHTDQIKKIVNTTSIPIIANGDVCNAETAKKLLKATNAAGVMIARASLGQPWIFKKITAALDNDEFQPPRMAENGKNLLQHVRELITLDGERTAILQSRKLIQYYLRQRATTTLLSQGNQITTYSELEKFVDSCFR